MSGLSPRDSRAFATAALGLLAAALAGCTTLGSNVEGSFSCAAPGGSCAPSSVIDDSAIATIQGHSANEAISPAGPYEVDDGDTPGMRVASADAPVRRTTSQPRANGRLLRVVFPAYVDRYGQLHEKSAVQAQVDVGEIAQLADRSASASLPQGPDAGLFGAAESAPQMLAFAPPGVTPGAPEPKILAQALPSTKNVTVRRTLPKAALTTVTLPKFAKVGDAAPASEAPLLIAAIKDQVASKLAQSAKVKAADFPAQVD